MSVWTSLKIRFNQLTISEKLIAVMIVLFVLPFFSRTLLFLFNISSINILEWFGLYPSFESLLIRPWTLITYGFFHASLGHIFWNLLLLYFVGRMLLNLFNERQFINIFFNGILVGGVVFVVSYSIFPAFSGQFPPLIGSSAGVMALLVFLAAYAPYQEIYVWFVRIKIVYIALFLVLIDVVQIPTNNAGGHLAHLGGAFWGWLYQHQLAKGTDIGRWFSNSCESVVKWFSSSKTPFKAVYKTKKTKKEAPKSNIHQQKIDAILDKITASGYESLTQEEKDFLFKSGNQ
jgi:membrane associated rhomboid family serine protease